MTHFLCRILLLGLLVAGALAPTAALAEECIAFPASGVCPAGYLFRQGTQALPNPLGMGPPIYLDNKCCKAWAGAGINRPGSDYRNFDLPKADPAGCRDACEREGKCIAWTYVQPGTQGPKAKCWLKSSVPSPRADPCCVSDVKGAGINRAGGDYKNTDLQQPNVNNCKAMCEYEAQCKAWTYVNPGVQGPKARCWLKNSVPAARADNCCWSGVK